MASKNKSFLQRSPSESKHFEYSVGNVSLKFDLNVDTKSQMKDFLQCLRAGIEDVEGELTKRFPNESLS